MQTLEMLHIADTVAHEKGLSREDILNAMEMAIQKAGNAKYGQEHDIRAVIDRKTGFISLKRVRHVVEEIEEETTQLTVQEAQRYKKGAVVGDEIIDELPPLDFGRIAAQTAKGVIIQQVREVERERQFEEFKDRVGDVINGVVKRVEFGNLFIDMGTAEGYIRRDELIPREIFRQGDRVRAYIYDVRKEGRGPQILLSRTHPQFMAKLFMQEVPEVYEGTIEIRSVARDPGSRAKICVYTSDPSIDPVGSCVGMRGSRVQAVVSELQGEKVDIIPWSEDLASLVVRALAPAEVQKVILDEEKGKIEAIVEEDQLSLAIGRRGQNVRLAAIMLGLDIDILTAAQESERRMEEFKAQSDFFKKALDVDEVISHLLVAEGFENIEQVAYVPQEEMMEIEGFDSNIALELINRAQAYIQKEEQEYAKKREELGFDEQLVTVAGLPKTMAIELAEKGIISLDDLADLAADELQELLPNENLTDDDANQIIMSARAHWFEGEEPAEEDTVAEA